MEELYIETTSGKIPLENAVIKKYRLHPGMLSPFTRSRIIGKNGEFPVNENRKYMGTNIDGPENDAILTQSEILDFTQGADSSV